MRFFGVSLNGERDSIAPEGPSATQDDHQRSIAADSVATDSIVTDSFVTDSVVTDSVATGSIATDSDFSLTDGTIVSLSDALSESDDDHRARSFSLVDADDVISPSSLTSQFGSEPQGLSRREYPQLLNPVQPELLDDCCPPDYNECGKATQEETAEEIGEGMESLDSDCSEEYIEYGKAMPKETVEEYSEEMESLDSDCSQEYIEPEGAAPEETVEKYSEEMESLDSDYSQEYIEHGEATPKETVEEYSREIEESLDSSGSQEYIEHEGAAPEELLVDVDGEISEPLDSNGSEEYIEHEKATPEELVVDVDGKISESLDSGFFREYIEHEKATPEDVAEERDREFSAAPIARSHNATPLGSALNQSYMVLGAEGSSIDGPVRSGASLVESRATSDSSVNSPKDADDFEKQSETGLAESLIRVSRSSSLVVASPELLPANMLADSSMEPLLKCLEEAPSAHPTERSIGVYEALERNGIPDNLATQALEELESVLRKYATSAGVDAVTFADFCQGHVSSRLESLSLRDVPLVERAPQLNAGSTKRDIFEPISEYETDMFLLSAKEMQQRARSLRPGTHADPIVFLRRFVRNEDGTANPKMYKRFSFLVSRRKNESLRGFVMRMIRSTSFVPTRDQEDYISIVLPVAIVLGLRKHYQFIAADHRRFLTEAPEFHSTQSILSWFGDSSRRTRAHTRYFRYH